MSEFDLGFLGGGQLARMSIQAAQRMGLRCISLDKGSDTPAGQIAPSVDAALDDATAIRNLFDRASRVTLENEFVPAAALAISGADLSKLLPGIECLATIQDKLSQRLALTRAGVPSPRACRADEWKAGENYPIVLKSRFGGYDGKGVQIANNLSEYQEIASLIPLGDWLAEEFAPFTRELAVMVMRSSGATFALPTMETLQTNQVCDLVFAAHRDCSEIAIAAVEAVEGWGLFGVELFELADGAIWVNEIAPRPHNSGHYTLDWGSMSQFDLHVRVAAGLPLDKPIPVMQSVMANLLGVETNRPYTDCVNSVLAHPGARFHWYGKTTRMGRKMGHLNMVDGWDVPTGELVNRALEARDSFLEAWMV